MVLSTQLEKVFVAFAVVDALRVSEAVAGDGLEFLEQSYDVHNVTLYRK